MNELIAVSRDALVRNDKECKTHTYNSYNIVPKAGNAHHPGPETSIEQHSKSRSLHLETTVYLVGQQCK